MLDHIAPVLYVKSLAESVEFYEKRLVFELEFEYEGFYAGLVRDGCRLHLKQSDERRRTRGRNEDDVDVAIAVSDAAALASELGRAGAPFSVPLREMRMARSSTFPIPTTTY